MKSLSRCPDPPISRGLIFFTASGKTEGHSAILGRVERDWHAFVIRGKSDCEEGSKIIAQNRAYKLNEN
jgi:hypothetical protein